METYLTINEILMPVSFSMFDFQNSPGEALDTIVESNDCRNNQIARCLLQSAAEKD